MPKNNLVLKNLDREKQAWPYDKSASWKDSTNVNDSLPQRSVCNTIYVADAIIYPGLVVTDYSKRYRNNQTMAELMYCKLV